MSSTPSAKPSRTVVLAGATGNLGMRTARALRRRGAHVVALVRPGAAPAILAQLTEMGAQVCPVDYEDTAQLTQACLGADCVVSALAGLADVIVGAQSSLLQATVQAAVPRFMPSDFSLDFNNLTPGSNRNLDLRRDFAARLDGVPLAVTSVLCGAFAELLTGPAPLVFPRLGRVLYWGDPDVAMDFTAMDDVAAFVAAAAMEAQTPRTLRVAGSTLSARQLAQAASTAWEKPFKVTRAGSLKTLARLIKAARFLAPQPGALYPPWQGMQYLHNMFGGAARLSPLDNGRYPDVAPTPVAAILAAYASGGVSKKV